MVYNVVSVVNGERVERIIECANQGEALIAVMRMYSVDDKAPQGRFLVKPAGRK